MRQHVKMLRLCVLVALLLLATANQASASWFSKFFGYPEATDGQSIKVPPIVKSPAASTDEKLVPIAKPTTPQRHANSTTSPVKHNFDNYQIKKIKENVERLGSMSELIFLGDSVFYRICRNKTRWMNLEKNYAAINLGSPGDRTEHLLHRFSEGRILSNITSVRPLVVTMIGASNAMMGDNPSSIIHGVFAAVQLLNKYLQNPKIVVLSLLPRTIKPASDIIAATNVLLASHFAADNNHSVTYIDVAKEFLFANETVNFAFYSPDRITPNAAGQVLNTTNFYF